MNSHLYHAWVIEPIIPTYRIKTIDLIEAGNQRISFQSRYVCIYVYYLYQWCTVKKISDNEIYLLIKYIKSVLWRVAKRLSYIEDAWCLKVKAKIHTAKIFNTYCLSLDCKRTKWRLLRHMRFLGLWRNNLVHADELGS